MGLIPARGNLNRSIDTFGGLGRGIPAFADVEFDIGRAGRNITKNLAYPEGVESDAGQGHYIIFEIHKQDKSKLRALKATVDLMNRALEIAKQVGAGNVNNVIANFNQAQATTAPARGGRPKPANKGNKQSGPNSLQLAQKATTKMPVCIALYMPPSVQVSYGVKYNEQDIGVLAETGNAAIQAFTGGSDLNWTEGVTGGAKALAAGGFNLLKEKAPAGTAAVFAINTGSIITPRMELMFEGIMRRTFSFNFTFLPKSEPEADIVEQIVKMFKYHMASNYGGLGLGGVDGVREMEIPDFFQIVYKYQGKENTHLNKISTCVLNGMDVTYGAERFKTYAGGVPQTTQISLSFAELNIITKKHIEVGY
jgi:hypothetical protein